MNKHKSFISHLDSQRQIQSFNISHTSAQNNKIEKREEKEKNKDGEMDRVTKNNVTTKGRESIVNKLR